MIKPRVGFIVFGVHKDGLPDPMGAPFIDAEIVTKAKGSLEHSGVDLVSHDVVLIEIGPRLNLDEEGRNLTEIGEPMSAANRNVSRLVLAQQLDVVALGDLKRAGYHDPMLGPVIVAL